MSTKRFFRTGVYSLFAAALFALYAASCSNTSGTRYVEVDPPNDDSAKTCTIKEASYVLHYQQKVMTDDSGKDYVTTKGEGFGLVQSEDKSAAPIPVQTEFKKLAKDFLGFSYSYAVQKDKTVYLYYTRNTIEYSFYNSNPSQPLALAAKVSGTYGLPCAPPNVMAGGKVVAKWKDRLGAALPEKFMSKDDEFFPNGTGIGTKAKPDAVGDIVFCDGTAATTAQVNAAWASGDPVFAEYKKNAIAAIIFDRYNANTGEASGGDKIIGVGIQALNAAYPNDGSAASVDFKSMFEGAWRENGVYKYSHICVSKYGWQDFCDLKNLFGSVFDDDNSFRYDWTALFKAVKYGATLKSNTDMNIDDKLLEGWYLPNWHEMGLLAAYNFKYKETLRAACNALDFSGYDCSAYWVTASKTQGEDPVYAAYINPANPYMDFTELMNAGDYDAKYWVPAITGECQTLPFREFK